MKYVTILDPTDNVQVRIGIDELSETIAEMTVTDALVTANKYNLGLYHPDVYVYITQDGTEVVCVSTVEANECDLDQLGIIV